MSDLVDLKPDDDRQRSACERKKSDRPDKKTDVGDLQSVAKVALGLIGQSGNLFSLIDSVKLPVG